MQDTLPSQLDGKMTLDEFLALEGSDWDTLNHVRGRLIGKEVLGTISESEAKRLEMLQAYADYHVDKAVGPWDVRFLEVVQKNARKLRQR